MTADIDNVVVFDGVCNLCAHCVRFVIEHERDPLIRFAPLQSTAGSVLLRRVGFDPADVKTFVFVQNGKTYVRSDAAIELARHLRGVWRLLVLLKFIPRVLRDWLYDVVAQNRYRWFGRLDACMVPSPELRARFIEEVPT